MLTSDLRNKIDRVWEQFWTGGLSNPITAIEQMTYLLFIRRLNDIHIQREQEASFLKKTIEKHLGSIIRSIVGIDQSAANTAFSSFIKNLFMNAYQIRFVNRIIQYLSTNGVINAEKLFEPTFTELNNRGLLGVLNEE